MPITPDALLGALITVGLAALVALWKLATMLAEVRGQVRHNGGSSLKDDARTAATEAVNARTLAERVAAELVEFRQHQADDSASTAMSLGRVQHDLTNIRSGQELLLKQQLVTDGRVTSHEARNVVWRENLQAAVDELNRSAAERDRALGSALQESLDVAIEANAPDDPHR